MARTLALATVVSVATLAVTSSAFAAPASFSGASADGGTVFFTSSDQLVAGDTDIRVDVYERAYDDSLERHVTRLVSSGPIGGNDAFTALYDGSSADGSRAFFSTDERLVGADTDHSEDIYMRNLATSTTTLVSQGDPGCSGCGNGEFDAGFAPGGVIRSGTRVFFVSSEPLESEDTDGSADVYRRDLDAGTTTLVSLGDVGCLGGGCGNGPFSASFRGASIDGSKAFVITTEGLLGGDVDGLLDIYQRDIASGTTSLVSTTGTCPVGLDCSAAYGDASVSGSHVYFETNERLGAGDDDDFQDVYIWSAGTASLVSAGPLEGDPSAAIFAGATAAGDEVFFETSESLIAGDDDDAQDVYSRSGGVTTLISTGPADGDLGVPASFRWVSPDGSGSAVLFNTAEPMTAGDADASQDVYSRSGGVTTLISTGTAGGNGPLDASFAGASSDGSHIFAITAEALVAQDTDASADVYEMASGVTTLISTGPAGGKGPISAGLPAGGVAEDGSHAFFITEERLTVDDLDAETDVYDHSADGTLLVSVGNAAPLGPPTPSQLSTDPGSPGVSTTPRVKGQADPNTSIKIYTTPDCSGAPVAIGTSIEFGGAGIEATVLPDSTTSFRATATDSNGDISPCSGPVSYTQQSTEPPPPPPPPPSDPGNGGTSGGDSGGTPVKPGGGGSKKGGAVHVTPKTLITFAPAGVTRALRPIFRFTDSTGQEGTTFSCKVDGKRWAPCSSPTKVKRLKPGRHVFQVRATNAIGSLEPTAVKRKFKVVGR